MTLPMPPTPDPEPTSDTEIATRRLWPRLLFGGALAIVAASGLAIFADARALGTALRDFPWWLTVPVLALALFNYALRFLKWELYLRALNVAGVDRGTSGLIFLSGFSMSVTPGKAGEIIKGVLLRRVAGTPLSRSAAILAAERISDGIAMLVLAGVGLIQFSQARPLLAVAALGAGGVALVLQRPAALAGLLTRFERLPVIGSKLHHLADFLAASGVLVRPRLLLAAVALGTVSWAGECVALYLILGGLGIDPSWHLLLVATFTLAVSSIAGAVSLLPGGLGVAEASVTGLLLALVTDAAMTRGVAAAATLLIRFATLWFAVLLGVVALAMLHRRLSVNDTVPVRARPDANDPVMTPRGGTR